MLLYTSGFTFSKSRSHTSEQASLGILQSPLGDNATVPTFGPSGRQERLNCWIKNLLQKYDYDSCSLVADYDDGSKGTMSKSVLGTPTAYAFEDTMLLGVEDYDTYLSNKYGDYMTIPKHSAQRQHNFHYLNLDKPYRENKDVN